MWVSSRILNPDLSRPQIPIFPLWININFVFQIALSSNPETHPLLSLTFHTEDISKPYLRYLHHTVLSHLSAACLSKNCFSPELLQWPTNWFAYFFHCSFPNPPHNAIPCHGSVQNLPKSLLKRKKKYLTFSFRKLTRSYKISGDLPPTAPTPIPWHLTPSPICCLFQININLPFTSSVVLIILTSKHWNLF